MSSFELELKAIVGRNILDCAIEGVRIANKLNIIVTFDFNGVKCVLHPKDKPESLVTAYKKIVNSKVEYKIAFGRPKKP